METSEAILRALVLAGFGGLLILSAYGIATQRWLGRHGFARWYHHQYRVLPAPQRNWPFAAIPLGILVSLAAGLSLLLPLAPKPGSTDRLTMVLWLLPLGAIIAVILGLLILMVIAFFRPPRWLKPAWLLEDEVRLKAGLPSLVPSPPEGDRPVISRLDAALTAGLAIVVPAGVIFLGWPPALLIGLGVALPMLARARIRQRKPTAGKPRC